MVAPAALVTTVFLLALLFVLGDQLSFLRSFKARLWQAHADFLLVYLGLLAVNIFAATLVVTRKIGLKTTGQKLQHLDQELHGAVNLPHDDQDDAGVVSEE